MSTDLPYVIGETVRLSLAVTDADDVAADPGALRLKVKSPFGVVTTYTYGTDAEVVKISTGNYRADIPLGASGNWYWRWEADAPNPGAAESSLTVQASNVI